MFSIRALSSRSSSTTHSIAVQLDIQVPDIRPYCRVPLVTDPLLLLGSFRHLVKHVCRSEMCKMISADPRPGKSTVDPHSSSSNMAVSFFAAGANDVLVKEAEACPLVKFDALSNKHEDEAAISLDGQNARKPSTYRLSEPWASSRRPPLPPSSPHLPWPARSLCSVATRGVNTSLS